MQVSRIALNGSLRYTKFSYGANDVFVYSRKQDNRIFRLLDLKREEKMIAGPIQEDETSNTIAFASLFAK